MKIHKSNILTFEEFKLLAGTSLAERMIRNKYVVPVENIFTTHEVQKWHEAARHFTDVLEANAQGLIACDVVNGKAHVFFEHPANSDILRIYNAD